MGGVFEYHDDQKSYKLMTLEIDTIFVFSSF